MSIANCQWRSTFNRRNCAAPIALLCLSLVLLCAAPHSAQAVTASNVALIDPVNSADLPCPAESLATIKTQLTHHFRYPYYEILPPATVARHWNPLSPSTMPSPDSAKYSPTSSWPQAARQLAAETGAVIVIIPEIVHLRHNIHQAPFSPGERWEETYVELRCHVYTVAGDRYRVVKAVAYGSEDASLTSNLQYRIQEAWDRLLPQLPATIPLVAP